MTTTSDRDGRTPAEPDHPFPTPPAYGVMPDDADGRPTVILTPYGELPAYSHDDVLPSRPVGGRRAARTSGRPPRRTGPTRLGRVVLPAALAFVSGIALVAGWSTLQDDKAAQSAQGQAAAVQRAVAAAPSHVPVASGAPKAVASSARAATPTSGAASSARAASSAPAVAALDRSVPVVVLNSTTRTGLAAKAAAALRKDGWTVVSIGNYRPELAATTVYAQGHAAAVTTIRGDLPTRGVVHTPVAAMNPDRITVVVGPDYPRG